MGSRRRRLTSEAQEYRLTVQVKIALALSEVVRDQFESHNFAPAVTEMLKSFFETVDGSEFRELETKSTEAVSPQTEEGIDNYSVPVAASAGAVGGAALVIGV